MIDVDIMHIIIVAGVVLFTPTRHGHERIYTVYSATYEKCRHTLSKKH